MEAIYENHNFLSICEFLPNHLYFVTVQSINNGGSCEAVIPHTDELHFFNTDTELMYHNFYGDFGPLSIACLYKFCKKLTNKLATYAGDAFYEKFVGSRFGRKDIAEKLQEKFVKKKVVIYYTSTNNEKRANAAFLIASFAVLYLGFSPRLAHKALRPTKMRYRPFQDASVGLSPYKITMKDCLDAVHKASVFGFFNFNDFNASECTHFENVDANWIVPQKLLAFPGPVEEKNDYYRHPNFYVEYFLTNNVTDVVRLNRRAYDAKCFTMFHLKHHDLYVRDGADPPEAVLNNFMNIAENAGGAIAVHCKAGLGRTGSLIGAYLLKHYRMTAREAIAWVRICRPGSVISHQQTWLENHEQVLWYEGNEWRYKMYGKTEIVPFLPYGIYSFESPKKEYPGLRELLENLTKRARYRFIVKNRPKKSKTRIQQMIKNIIESGKSVDEKEKNQQTTIEEKSSYGSNQSELTKNVDGSKYNEGTKNMDLSQNVRYLKAPPEMEEIDYYEYPKDIEDIPTKTTEYCDPNYYVRPKHEGIYSNYQDSEYSQPTFPEKKRVPMGVPKNSQIPKSQSTAIPTKIDRNKMNSNSMSKSIDKNWEQNTPKYAREERDEYEEREENVCAFDSGTDTISQYGLFDKSFLNKNYGEESDYVKFKPDKYDYRKSGYLLSPDDFRNWAETFQEKGNYKTQGDKLNAIKRSKV